MAGYFEGHNQMTAAIILLNVYMVAYQFSLSMGLTSCNLIGRISTSLSLVKKLAFLTTIYGFSSQAIICALMWACKKFIHSFYT
jgi:hypothetical protein